MLGGGLVNWWYETRRPGIALTTAPSKAQVEGLLWKEVRAQAPAEVRASMPPKAPFIQDPTHEHHYAIGYTARDANSFQGRHEEELLIIFDEATGIAKEFWTGADGMLTGPDTRHLAILNPTDTTSAAYEADLSGKWHVITISALDHPNIAAELRSDPPPFPKAVRLAYIEDHVRDWCTPIAAADVEVGRDIEFPPGSGQWYRPGPEFEGKVLGRWPSQATNNVWSDLLIAAALRDSEPYPPLEEPDDELPQIGCDVARFGDDFTSIHVRRGAVSLHHETHNGWDTTQTAGRLKQLAGEYGQRAGVDGRNVPVLIDDDGVGGGVTDKAGGYAFFGCSGQSAAFDDEGYPNRRSEVWFAVAQRAKEGRLDLSRLDARSKMDLRRQFMAPTWRLDEQGRRKVEPKDRTKERIGRSPDDADAINLAYSPTPQGLRVIKIGQGPKPAPEATMDDTARAASAWQAQLPQSSPYRRSGRESRRRR